MPIVDPSQPPTYERQSNGHVLIAIPLDAPAGEDWAAAFREISRAHGSFQLSADRAAVIYRLESTKDVGHVATALDHAIQLAHLTNEWLKIMDKPIPELDTAIRDWRFAHGFDED
jgi:hypothetical protein